MRQEIKEHLGAITYSDSGFARTICPVCGSKDTFTAQKKEGSVLYNCYDASCPITGGATKYERSLSEVLSWYNPKQDTTKPFEMPTHFVSYRSHSSVVDYLQKNNCTFAVASGLVQVFYDPRQDRVVFLIEDQGNVVDAVGRTLRKNGYPKWYRYGTSTTPLLVGKGRELGVLVEDAASACAVSELATGISLLGSSLSSEHKLKIIKFKEVIVALDKDAARKGVDIGTVLSAYTKCRTVYLRDDLKYYGTADNAKTLGIEYAP